jgi:tRNA pseudouridine synthase D (truD)
MEIVLRICETMKLKREQLGIAGLKDKEGITKQRISISKKNLKNC